MLVHIHVNVQIVFFLVRRIKVEFMCMQSQTDKSKTWTKSITKQMKLYETFIDIFTEWLDEVLLRKCKTPAVQAKKYKITLPVLTVSYDASRQHISNCYQVELKIHNTSQPSCPSTWPQAFAPPACTFRWSETMRISCVAYQKQSILRDYQSMPGLLVQSHRFSLWHFNKNSSHSPDFEKNYCNIRSAVVALQPNSCS